MAAIDLSVLRTHTLWKCEFSSQVTPTDIVKEVIRRLNGYLHQLGASILLAVEHYKDQLQSRVVGLRISIGRSTRTISLFPKEDCITIGENSRRIIFFHDTALAFAHAVLDEIQKIEDSVDKFVAEILGEKPKGRAPAT